MKSGSLNAAKYGSKAPPPPNVEASSRSRTKPSTRLSTPVRPITIAPPRIVVESFNQSFFHIRSCRIRKNHALSKSNQNKRGHRDPRLFAHVYIPPSAGLRACAGQTKNRTVSRTVMSLSSPLAHRYVRLIPGFTSFQQGESPSWIFCKPEIVGSIRWAGAKETPRV